ncbi:MAG TPA: aminotransferase class IV, partial [Bdellovibrionota bacterium]|nr:aminotransferase class IV [Bdellovibrionota bacterium]
GILNQKAVFDFLTSYGNKPFHLQDHIKRLRESVRLKDLPPIQLSDEEIASIIRKLIDGNKIENPNIRIVYSAGVNFDPTFYILTEASHPYPKEIYEKGIKVILDEYQRPMPGAKHDYSNAIDNGEKQKSEGAFEILYTWEGNVLEATTSNVFIVKGGVLITPPEGRILPGLTRQIVLKLAREEGLAVNERDISLEELLHADEVFITGSTKKVVPVAKVGNATIGSGIVGKTTKKLMAVYQEYIDSGEWKEVAPKSLQHAIRTSMGRLIGTVGFPDFNNDKNAEERFKEDLEFAALASIYWDSSHPEKIRAMAKERLKELLIKAHPDLTHDDLLLAFSEEDAVRLSFLRHHRGNNHLIKVTLLMHFDRDPKIVTTAINTTSNLSVVARRVFPYVCKEIVKRRGRGWDYKTMAEKAFLQSLGGDSENFVRSLEELGNYAIDSKNSIILDQVISILSQTINFGFTEEVNQRGREEAGNILNNLLRQKAYIAEGWGEGPTYSHPVDPAEFARRNTRLLREVARRGEKEMVEEEIARNGRAEAIRERINDLSREVAKRIRESKLIK